MNVFNWSVRALIGMALAMGLSGCGNYRVKSAPVAMKASAARPGEALAPIAFDAAVVNLQRGAPIGISRGGGPWTGCGIVGEENTINWSGDGSLANDPEFSELFSREMKAANYSVVGDPNELFASYSDNSKDPAYLVGGRIDSISIDLCEVSGGKQVTGRELGTGRITVTWQLFSPLERKVAFEIKTDGYGEIRKGIQDGATAIFTNAFASATANLAADPKFHDFLLANKPNSVAVETPVNAPERTIQNVAPLTGGIGSNVGRIERSVVTVVTGGGHGSGFFISPTLVLTNHHVAGGSKRVKLQFVDGREIYATVLRSHPDRDVALLEVETGSYEALPIRSSRAGITEEVYAVGSPIDESLSGTVTRGIVSQIKPDERNREFIQADVNIQHGSSGGPLLDRDGNVVGISDMALTDQADSSMGINFFIPIGDALKKLNIVLN